MGVVKSTVYRQREFIFLFRITDAQTLQHLINSVNISFDLLSLLILCFVVVASMLQELSVELNFASLISCCLEVGALWASVSFGIDCFAVVLLLYQIQVCDVLTVLAGLPPALCRCHCCSAPVGRVMRITEIREQWIVLRKCSCIWIRQQCAWWKLVCSFLTLQ